jgi:excisionase family DNA binding protein
MKYLSVQSVADILGMSKQTIYNWISLRRIESVKLGTAVRIPSTEIERLVSNGRRPAASK